MFSNKVGERDPRARDGAQGKRPSLVGYSDRLKRGVIPVAWQLNIMYRHTCIWGVCMCVETKGNLRCHCSGTLFTLLSLTWNTSSRLDCPRNLPVSIFSALFLQGYTTKPGWIFKGRFWKIQLALIMVSGTLYWFSSHPSLPPMSFL